MELLVQQGKVIYIGSSNFGGWDIATAQCAAAARHFMGLVCEQSLYNLHARTTELEVIPACRQYGLGLIPWSPLGGGLLSGALRKTKAGRRAEARMQQQIEEHHSQLEAYEARTVEQLTASLRALKVALSDETLRKLDEIWPGPGGEAPKAYAW